MIDSPLASTAQYDRTGEYDRTGTVFVIGNSAPARSRAVGAASSTGLRVVGQSDFAGARDSPAYSATVFVEVDAPCDEDALHGLLVQVNADAATARCATIVSTPAALIDFVAACAPAVGYQLADATDTDRIAALLLAAVPLSSVVREAAAANPELVRLARLTEEVARVAAAIARVSPAAVAVLPSDSPSADHPVGADEIRGLIRARKLRAQYFDSEMFADPAWDMLLDLAAAHAAGERVAVSSLCIAAAVPPTTALRWIRTLTDAGLFVRTADPADGRRVFVELSESAAASMQAYLSAHRRLAD